MSTQFVHNLRAGVAAAVAAAASLAMLVAPSAFAADGDPSGVQLANIDTTQTASLTIHKYAGQQCTGSTNGTGLTTDANSIDTSKCTALKGVKFSVTPVLYNNAKIDLANKAGWDLINGKAETSMLNTDGSWNANNTGNFSLGTSTTVTTDETGTAKFSNNQAGNFTLYYVQETYSPVQTTGFIKPFLVSLPYPSSGTGDWLYDVNVYPKNTTTNNTLQKMADAQTGSRMFMDSATSTNSAQVFWVKLPLPVTNGNYTEIWIQDQLQKYFSITAEPAGSGVVSSSNVAVYFKNDQPINGDTYLTSDSFTVTFTGGTPDTTAPARVWGANVKVSLNEKGRAAAKTATASGIKNMWVRLGVRIDASQITNGVTGVLANNVTSDVKDDQDNDTPGNTDPDPSNPDNPKPNPDPSNPNNGVTKWGTINIRKYEGAAGAAYDSTHVLKGAQFTIFLPKDANSASLTDAQCQADGALSNATAKKEYTTGDNGEVTIKAYVGNTAEATNAKYCILETAAPAGYQTPAATTAKAVTFTADGSTTNVAPVDVPNQKTDITNLVKLPLTGAAGLVLLTVAGAALISGAFFMLVAARRRREEEDL